MAGATIVNATVLHNTTYGVNVWMTALLCAVLALVACGRRQQIKDVPATMRRVKKRLRASSTSHPRLLSLVVR